MFVAGDMGRGQSLIVWAIAEGRSRRRRRPLPRRRDDAAGPPAETGRDSTPDLVRRACPEAARPCGRPCNQALRSRPDGQLGLGRRCCLRAGTRTRTRRRASSRSRRRRAVQDVATTSSVPEDTTPTADGRSPVEQSYTVKGSASRSSSPTSTTSTSRSCATTTAGRRTTRTSRTPGAHASRRAPSSSIRTPRRPRRPRRRRTDWSTEEVPGDDHRRQRMRAGRLVRHRGR